MRRVWRYRTISKILDYSPEVSDDRFDQNYRRVIDGLSRTFSVDHEDNRIDSPDFSASRWVDPCATISICAFASAHGPIAASRLREVAASLDDDFTISVDATGDDGAYLVFFPSGEVWGYSGSRAEARILQEYGFKRHPILG